MPSFLASSLYAGERGQPLSVSSQLWVLLEDGRSGPCVCVSALWKAVSRPVESFDTNPVKQEQIISMISYTQVQLQVFLRELQSFQELLLISV